MSKTDNGNRSIRYAAWMRETGKAEWTAYHAFAYENEKTLCGISPKDAYGYTEESREMISDESLCKRCRKCCRKLL